MYTSHMSEGVPTHTEKAPTRRETIIALAIELHESQEVFPFPGLDSAAHAKVRADIERDADESGYTVAMFDELLERFEKEGMKVVLGKNPKSGNVYILPAQSDDIEMDNLSPKQLQLSEGMNEKLCELILLVRG